MKRAKSARAPGMPRPQDPVEGNHLGQDPPVSATQGAVLEALVEGTGRDGSPPCASVKDFEACISGWRADRLPILTRRIRVCRIWNRTCSLYWRAA
jgi:hypothetical protein